MHPLQRAWVPSLVRELRFLMPSDAAKKKSSAQPRSPELGSGFQMCKDWNGKDLTHQSNNDSPKNVVRGQLGKWINTQIFKKERRSKSLPTGKEETKWSLFEDDIILHIENSRGFPDISVVKNPPVMQESHV